jgi:hypothetical protein
VGVLESRALKQLLPLSAGRYPIRFEAVLPESQWQEKVQLAWNDGGRANQRITVEIDAFGPRHMSEKVAKALGAASFFLQRPTRLIIPPYENPQCLDLNLPAEETEAVHRLASAMDTSGFDSSGITRSSRALQENTIFDFDQILDGSRAGEYTGNVEVDHRITTSLIR